MNLLDKLDAKIEGYIQTHKAYSEKMSEIGELVEKMPGPEQMLLALKCAVEALNSIGSSYIKSCNYCDGGEFKHDDAKEALTEITKLLEQE